MARSATEKGQGTGFSKAFGSFSANDIPAAKEFYSNTLGLNVKEQMGGLGLNFENGMSVFIYPKPNHQAATFTVLNFYVSDIRATVSNLKAKGVEFEKYDGDVKTDENGIMWGKESNHGPNIAWFKDPAGNILSIVED